MADLDGLATIADIAKLGDLAAEAGLQRVSMLAWRDLDDPEAGGSEVHASTVARLWAEAGIEVTIRTSFAAGQPQMSWRNGYRVIRKAGRYMVFPRAAFSEMMGWHGGKDGLVEIWNGMPFMSPVWARTPHVTWLHHVHADMWNMTLPPKLATVGRTLESRIAPKFYRRTPIVTLSDSSKRELVDDLHFKRSMVHVVPPGIDPRFSPGGPKSPTPLVVAVGRLVPVKRFEVLVEALVRLRSRHPDLEAVIVGEGYRREQLETQIHEARAERWLHLVGHITDDEVIDLYRRAWVLSQRVGAGRLGHDRHRGGGLRDAFGRDADRGSLRCGRGGDLRAPGGLTGRARQWARPGDHGCGGAGTALRGRAPSCRAVHLGRHRPRHTRGARRGGAAPTPPLVTVAVAAHQTDLPPGSTSRATRRAGYGALALLAYVPVLFSAVGHVAADTKQYLYLDPGRLLSRAWSMWDPNIGFGTVTHQNIGYLFPMGPFYWTFQTLGVPDWIAQRLWLGSILFAAGLGMLYLFRTLGVRGAGAVVGALMFMLSPYSLDYAARISVILLPWAGLPWMVALIIRSLRQGGWWHAAWFAIVVQIVGGVNATALVFAGIAPAWWIVHAVVVTREVRLRRAVGTLLRTGALTVAASAWWIAGLWAQGSYGLNILKYTETLRAVSRTSLPNEVLRGLGYWFFYGRDKLGSWIEASPDFTQRPLLIVISYGIPVLALLGAAFVAWKYRSYFVGLVAIGVIIAVGAYPYDHPTPIGGWFKELAASSTAAFALRSTGRATPLVVLGLAGLLAAGTSAFAGWVGSTRWQRVPLRVLIPVVVGVLILANLPALWNNTFYGGNLQRPEDVPGYWHEATSYLDAQPHDTRVMELPGADFASYRWGNTVDPITPGLMDRPYVARELIPYGSAASANLLNAFDLRIQDRSLPPAALSPMAQLTNVGDYVLRNDLQFERYRVLRPQFLEDLFTPTPDGLTHAASFGTPESTVSTLYPFLDEQALATTPGPTPPPVDVYGVDHPTATVRAAGEDRPILMSGDGDGIVDLASIGSLDRQSFVLESAAFDAAALRSQVRPDAALVVTDTNRLQARRWSTVTDTLGYTEGPGNHPIRFDETDARLDLFPDAAANASTRVRLEGARRVGATSYGNPITYTPEDRPARAFDGDTQTAWRTGAFADVRGERILVETDHPTTTDHVNLVQVMRPPRGRWITKAVLRFDGGHATTVTLGGASRTRAGQTLTFPKRTFRTLSIEIRDTNLGQLRSYGGIDPVGFAEIRLQSDGAASPVRIREITELPTDLTSAVGRSSASHPLAYSMSRERVIPVPPRRDPELSMTRELAVPTARDFTIGAEVRLSSWAKDPQIDRLLGYRGPLRATASARLPGDPADRASAAFDHDPATAWVTPFDKVVGQHVSLAMPRATTVDHLDLSLVADGLHSVPTALTVSNEAGEQRQVTVPAVSDQASPGAVANVTVRFAPIAATRLTVGIAAVRPVLTHEWYCECDQQMPVGVAEVGVPDQAPITIAAEIPDRCRDDLLAVDGQPVPARIVGSTATALALDTLRLQTCGTAARPSVHLGRGRHTVVTGRGDQLGWDLDRVVLASDAQGAPTALGDAAAISLPTPSSADRPVVQIRSQGRASVRAIVRHATKPFWLVLGQSQNAGWNATVDGTDLGTSTLVDGFANGWLVRPHGDAPIEISLDWTPQRTVNLALGITLAALLAAGAVIVTAGVRRRRRVAVDATRGAPEARFALPWRVAAADAGVTRTVLVTVASAAFAAVAVAPWAGVVTAAVVLLATRFRWVRVAVRLSPAVALAGCGAFIAAKQIYARFPATFEWPTFFGEVQTVGWMVVVLLVADTLLGDPGERIPEEH